MVLRHRQLGGIPLEKQQSIAVALLMSACVPTLGYAVWYPLLNLPEELRIWLALFSTAIHVGMSSGVIQAGHERAQLWFGTPTGVSFPNGIYLVPRLPFPFILLLVRVIFGEAIYQKILWSMEGDVRVESIRLQGEAEGMTRDGARVKILWMTVLEIVNVAVFRSQTRDDTDRQSLLTIIQAEYAAAVKTAVIDQHTVADLMRGYHSGGSQALNEWMTDAWRLVKDFGVRLERSPVTRVEILSKHVERAFDRTQAKGIFVSGAESLAETYAAFKEGLPAGTSEEVAFALFNADRIDNGESPIDINVVKFK